MAIFDSLLKRYNTLMYRLAMPSIRRACERDIVTAISLEYWAKQWQARHSMSPELEESARQFFQCVNETSKLMKEANRV